MAGKVSYKIQSSIGQTLDKLHTSKVEKLDARIRPLFANPVTYCKFFRMKRSQVFCQPQNFSISNNQIEAIIL